MRSILRFGAPLIVAIAVVAGASLAQGAKVASQEHAVRIADGELKARYGIPGKAKLSRDKYDDYYLRSVERLDDRWIVRITFDTGRKGRFLSVAIAVETGVVLRVWVDRLGA